MAKLPVDPAQEGDRDDRRRRFPPVDHALDLDMGARLELEVSPDAILGIVAGERPIDLDGMGIVALDEVGIIAVHRPHEVAQTRLKPRRDPTS